MWLSCSRILQHQEELGLERLDPALLLNLAGINAIGEALTPQRLGLHGSGSRSSIRDVREVVVRA
jgi:hypothetical protein